MTFANSKRDIVLAVVLLAGVSPAGGATIVVKADGTGDAPTIQAAIDAAEQHDEILVEPGTYYETLYTRGKTLTLRSTGGPEVTIVDAEESTAVLRSDFNEPAATLIEGFTLTNGVGYFISGPSVHSIGNHGGAIVLLSASPTIRDCILVDNSANVGGAVYAMDSASLFEDCVIVDNFAGDGGGIAIEDCQGIVFRNVAIRDNWGVFGGAFTALLGSNATFDRCRFEDNTGTEGGVCDAYSSVVTLSECVAVGNDAGDGSIADLLGASLRILSSTLVDNGHGIPSPDVFRLASGSSLEMRQTIAAFNGAKQFVTCSDGTVTITCSDVFNPPQPAPECAAAGDNISEDPLFCNVLGRILTLREESPCAPGNSPDGCDLVGALPVKCGRPAVSILEPGGNPGDGKSARAGATEVSTWGRIKARYARP